MIKTIFAILLSTLILGLSTSDMVIYGLFVFNQAQIEADFCVNKDEPTACCKGKCHLVKTIEKSKANSPSSDFPTTIVEQIEGLVLFVPKLKKQGLLSFEYFKEEGYTYLVLSSASFINKLLRPPTIS